MAIQGPGANGRRTGPRPGLDEEAMKVRLPDAAGQARNVPVKVLRGIFAGIGRLLLAADRIRAEEGTSEQAVNSVESVRSEQGEHEEPGSGQPANFRSLDSTGNVRILAPDEAPLPIPGYDALSLPSLRARLRNLDASQLHVLLEYEKSHAGRHDVVMMFERRITKLEVPAKRKRPDAS